MASHFTCKAFGCLATNVVKVQKDGNIEADRQDVIFIAWQHLGYDSYVVFIMTHPDKYKIDTIQCMYRIHNNYFDVFMQM